MNDLSAPLSPLEAFLRDYLEVAGGMWEPVEPQVYDLILPDAEAFKASTAERGIQRVTFDPEALPEHPAAQLACFGAPLIDGLLADALQRGRSARLYLNSLNPAPHNLESRVRRALSLPENAEFRIASARPLHFAQAVFWFECTFASDQKEQEIVPVGIDLFYGRQVRHLEELLDPTRLGESPSIPLPCARRTGMAPAYLAARERAIRTLAALANIRNRELSERLDRQVSRMARYYNDLRDELGEQVSRLQQKSEDLSKFASRREALDREEALRVAELKQKSSLRMHVRLLATLVAEQPKLLVRSQVDCKGKPMVELELVWDPLTESLEAPDCTECNRSTFELELAATNRLVCPTCAKSSSTAAPAKAGRR